jgi:hypothetical protein
MTAQFEKNAVNFVRLGSQLSRAFKGLKSAPKDLISVATGKGMPAVAKELGRAGRLGNLAGHAAIATGAVLGTNKLLNGGSKDSKAPNRGRPISSGQHPLDLRMREGLEAGRDAASSGLSKAEALEEFMKRYGGMGGSGQGGSIPKGMRFDARPRDWNRMGGTGGMAGKTAVGIAERNKLQPYQLELMDNIKSSPRYDYTPNLDKQAGLNYNLNTNTTVTPFAQLEKSAGINLARLGSQLSRAFKGFKAAPADFASFATGSGMPSVAKELGRAGQLGNLAGHGAITTGAVMGANKLLNGGSKDPTGEQKPNNGHALGAIHPDLKRKIDAGVATGIAGAQQDMGARTISYEDFRKLMEKNKLEPGERGTGLRPPSEPLFNNPFTSEGRKRIGTRLNNVSESYSPLMNRDELRALYGDGPMAAAMAQTDPFLRMKRLQYRQGNQ